MLKVFKPDTLGECVVSNPTLSDKALGSLLKGKLYTGASGWKVTRYDQDNEVYWFPSRKSAMASVNAWWGAP